MTLTVSIPDHAVTPASTRVPISAQINDAGPGGNECRCSACSSVREAIKAGAAEM